MKCDNCSNQFECYDGDHEFIQITCEANDWECFAPMTNADRIRSMTDEEIEDWYWWMHEEMMYYTDSRVFVHDWLKAPAEEGEG